MGPLLLLFISVPIVEIYLLAIVGGHIGFLNTIFLVIGTGILGASLARSQGVQPLALIQSELSQGRMPAGALVDGVIILLAGALLITPGVLTDVVGFLLLVPVTRWMARGVVVRWAKKRVAQGNVHVWSTGSSHGTQWGNNPNWQNPKVEIDPSNVIIEGEILSEDHSSGSTDSSSHG